MNPLATSGDSAIYHASWLQLLDVVDTCDLLAVDAPYSERTHGAHNAICSDKTGHTKIKYAHWGKPEVDEFVGAWEPKTTGWFVSITDTNLAPIWTAALASSGRYVFSPIACVEPGGRVRVSGDGPAQWSCFMVVARPKRRPFSNWGSLPGAYVSPPGFMSRLGHSGARVLGGKSPWMMERIISDYSRPGGVVVDPCCGAGTTVLAAIQTGRVGIGGDAMLEHAEIAASQLRRPIQTPMFPEAV